MNKISLKPLMIFLSPLLLTGCFSEYKTQQCILFKGKTTKKIWAGCRHYVIKEDYIGATSKARLVHIDDMEGAMCTFPENTAKDNAKLREAWRYCNDQDCFN